MKNNLKRIAIILPVIALLLAFLAVPAAADYSPETGWSEIGSELIPFRDYAVEGQSFFNSSMLDGGWAFVIDDSAFEIDYGLVDGSSNPRSIVQFTGFIGFVVDNNYYLYDDVNEENSVYFIFNGPYLAVYDGALGLGISDDQHIGVDLIYSRVYPDGFKVLLIPFADTLPVVDYPPASTMYNIIYPDTFSLVPFEALRFGEDVSPTEPIGNVWTGIMTWITSALTSVMGAFYVDGSLTLLGTLACIGVSVGIGFLLIGLIQRFLKLRG